MFVQNPIEKGTAVFGVMQAKKGTRQAKSSKKQQEEKRSMSMSFSNDDVVRTTRHVSMQCALYHDGSPMFRVSAHHNPRCVLRRFFRAA